MALAFNSAATGPKGNATDQAKKRRAGLMKAVIGSTHLYKCKDGKTRSFVVREYSAYPNAAVKGLCLYCRKSWETAEKLMEEHPSHNVMVKQGEPHVFVLWSDDPLPGNEPDPNDKSKKIDPSRVIGFLSDEYGVEAS